MEIHIGNRVADVELLGKDGNKVRLDIDGQPYEVEAGFRIVCLNAR